MSSFRFKGSGKHGLFYQVANTGFDKALPEKPIVKGMEITREFQNLKGEVVTKAKLGEELDVVITLHSHENKWIDNIALVDLLPGGFDLVLDKAGEGSTLETEFIDKREDRVVAYVSVQPKEKSFRYRIRPTNKGEYTIPPPYAESMYDLRIQARGLAKRFMLNRVIQIFYKPGLWGKCVCCFSCSQDCLFFLPKPNLMDGVGYSSTYYDRHGKLLRLTLAPDEIYRVRLSLGDIAPGLIEATLLQEDRYF